MVGINFVQQITVTVENLVDTGKSPEDSLVGEGTSLKRSTRKYNKVQESTKRIISNLTLSDFRIFPGVILYPKAKLLVFSHHDCLVTGFFLPCEPLYIKYIKRSLRNLASFV